MNQQRLIMAALFYVFTLFLILTQHCYANNGDQEQQPTKNTLNLIKIIDRPYHTNNLICSHNKRLYIIASHDSIDNLYRINNEGKGWRKVDEDETRSFSESMVIYKDYIYVGTLSGLSRIKIGENKWEHITNIPRNQTVSALYASQDCLYAGTNNGMVYMSKDGQNNWQLIGNSINGKITVLYVFENYLYAGTDNDCLYANAPTNCGLFRIKDGENYWQQTIYGRGILAIHAHNGYLYVGVHGGYSDRERSYNTGHHRPFTNAVYRLKASGWNWEHMGGEILHGLQGNALCSHDGYLYAGTNGGLFRATDGETWTKLKGELEYKSISKLYIHAGYMYAAADSGTIYRTTEQKDFEDGRLNDADTNEETGVDTLEQTIKADTSPECYMCICLDLPENDKRNYLQQLQEAKRIDGYTTENKCKRSCELRGLYFNSCFRKPEGYYSL